MSGIMACQLVVDIAAPVLSNQMSRRIIPTAERTVTRGGDKKIIDGRDAIRERLPAVKGFSHVAALVGAAMCSAVVSIFRSEIRKRLW